MQLKIVWNLFIQKGGTHHAQDIVVMPS